MITENKPIEVSEKIQIDLPKSRSLMSVDKNDWNRIKRMIGQISDNYNRWENAGWAMTSLSFGLSTTYLATNEQPLKSNFGISAIFIFLIGMLLFFVSHNTSKKLSNSKDDVMFEMDQIEKKFPINSNNKVAYFSGLKVVSAIYGKNDKNIDITQQLNEKIVNDKLSIKISNAIGGDPLVGVVKEAKVQYSYQGKEFEKNIAEGQDLILP